jgi:hypothetical protein
MIAALASLRVESVNKVDLIEYTHSMQAAGGEISRQIGRPKAFSQSVGAEWKRKSTLEEERERIGRRKG